MGVVSTAFALVILVINLLLRKTVIQPLNRITKVASEVSLGNMEAEFEQVSNDEIGKLAAAFNRMKTSLVMTLDMLKENK
jgi:HAMP domain-containing protein